jgi:hypothetical protein
MVHAVVVKSLHLLNYLSNTKVSCCCCDVFYICKPIETQIRCKPMVSWMGISYCVVGCDLLYGWF